MERLKVRRAPKATEIFGPVYMRDSSRIYIPYPVLKVCHKVVDSVVDKRGEFQGCIPVFVRDDIGADVLAIRP